MAIKSVKFKAREEDLQYDAAFREYCNGVQFNIMDLDKVRRETLALVRDGQSMVMAITISRDKYRQDTN